MSVSRPKDVSVLENPVFRCSRFSFLAAFFCLLILLATLGIGSCASIDSPGSVIVLGVTQEPPWSDLGNQFKKDTHIQVVYTATRAQDQVLRAAVQNGTPPDVAVLSSPGDLK